MCVYIYLYLALSAIREIQLKVSYELITAWQVQLILPAKRCSTLNVERLQSRMAELEYSGMGEQMGSPKGSQELPQMDLAPQYIEYSCY